ncbi:hypothetical protein [Clostridium felsineum]|uniref:hypothetical protein n=1 Tax=Clostridium felsineum TaxID=36839 RepID=UPI00098C3D63|nr:hypothetical protein [Clostridium felsineum]URZ03249.1 Exosporium protein C [Clostridium felsineum]URZ14581.1 Exosporium protein C [Clostridium felsineum DSM 794]
MHKHKKHHHHKHEVEKESIKKIIKKEKEEELKEERLGDDKEENVSAKMLKECKSDLVKFSIKAGFIPVRMPVIITEVVVNTDIENVIKLEGPIINIDSVKRRIKLQDCRLIAEANKLFLSGIVIKSIQYSRRKLGGNASISGEVRNITINIPFKCVTRVKYIVKPIISDRNRNLKIVDRNKDTTLMESYREEEKVYCELVSAKFQELNIAEKDGVEKFKRIKQKMVMHLTLRLVQNQTLFVLKGT